MGNKNVHLGFLHKPKVITPEDRIRLREMLEFILLGTHFVGKDDDIEQMMKSTPRVVCLKFIESMIAVNEPVNHNHISKFFDIYIADINSRMTLKCNIAKEFRHNPFTIRKDVAMVLCLMIGELVTNSLNQAIGSKKELSLNLTMGPDDFRENQFTVGFVDNGKGWVGNLDLRNTKQYGLNLCRVLEEKLEGKVLMANELGVGVGVVYEFALDKFQ